MPPRRLLKQVIESIPAGHRRYVKGCLVATNGVMGGGEGCLPVTPLEEGAGVDDAADKNAKDLGESLLG
eukprot:1180983-Prorocentrum_minimum.AAC.7